MNVRKIIVLVLTIILSISTGIPTLTAEVSPMYVNVEDLKISLSYSGSLAHCFVSIEGRSGTTKISATMTLQRRNTDGTYITLKTWPTESVNSEEFSMSKSYAVTEGCTYRLNISGNVTRNGTDEPVSAQTESYCG